MRKTSKMDKYNCKIQAHTSVCEENKLEELEEKTMPIEIILQ